MDRRTRLLIISDPTSYHTIKWVKSLAKFNFEILIFGLSKHQPEIYEGLDNINVVSMEFNDEIFTKSDGAFSKIIYLKSLKKLKQVIIKFKPDILHSHYATSYGLLGALTGFHPYIISVWGSDVYEFPHKSFLHKLLLKWIFFRADKILSTSHVMGKEIKNYSKREIEVIPFGIDVEKFKPMEVNSYFNKNDIVVGTIKALEEIYGIEHLIRAFKIVKDRCPELPLKLLLVGKGSMESSYRELITKLNLDNCTMFTGYINPDDIPIYHNMIDIFVAVSLKESFGVSILEASACEKIVLVSDVGGLTEIVENNVTGLIVPAANVQKIAYALQSIILHRDLSIRLGKNGRERVLAKYNLNETVELMKNMYKKLIAEFQIDLRNGYNDN
ncbi:MAG: glycosyltransferase [Ignavibacteriales bacterium]|nr:glycosyltransferase [Ignavibacteriales bacterium]